MSRLADAISEADQNEQTERASDGENEADKEEQTGLARDDEDDVALERHIAFVEALEGALRRVIEDFRAA